MALRPAGKPGKGEVIYERGVTIEAADSQLDEVTAALPPGAATFPVAGINGGLRGQVNG